MITIAYNPADAQLAGKIAADLDTDSDFERSETVQPGRENVLIAVISAAANADTTVENAILDSLDHGQHVIPVLAEQTELPRWLEHIPPQDFSTDYDYTPLRERLVAVTAPDAPAPIKVLTPRVKRSNRQVLLVIAVPVLLIFVAALYMIGVLGLRAPIEEYDEIDTQVAETRDFLIQPTLRTYATFLPRSTEDAAVFDSTARALPTRLRPFFAATATAIYDTVVELNATPTPTP